MKSQLRTKIKEHIDYLAKDWPFRSIDIHDNNPYWWTSVQTWDLEYQPLKVGCLSHNSSLALPDSESDKEGAITDSAVFPIKYAPDHLGSFSVVGRFSGQSAHSSMCHIGQLRKKVSRPWYVFIVSLQ
ncbi:hypothetical protein PDIG_70230 [Penicillium digitatum PHI26]|uniref:Uncharacterized protein n=2 Tax=Penicillium digitatum TaxID=36651 RepID=K9FIF3_PEND2|nr:hypothetical protein PDIP_79540 [Penicillium digitatum Pd1]EKV06329.1 hypothetical protein PDIP_79540 [Penicillium digitatum Pd1]EKV07947.1 hypothetical protein PDIG_70230 [Penicillium digitatum PHI26]